MKVSNFFALVAPVLSATTSVSSSASNGAASSSTSATSSDNGPWADDSHLQGTWSSKSQMVLTGPNFYDPVDELLIEPALPGISYSFRDGWFEQATYEIVANPRKPECSTGSLVFQHGTYTINSKGNITMTPIGVDGRMLVSDPCGTNATTSTYQRYTQTISMQSFSIQVDPYHGRYKLQMYAFDGSPVAPMYLVYRPAQMLPTMTLNPTSGGGSGSSGNVSSRDLGSNASLRQRARRALENRGRTNAVRQTKTHEGLWWLGVTLMVAGGAGFLILS